MLNRGVEAVYFQMTSNKQSWPCSQQVLGLTWDGLAVSQAHDLPIKDTAPPAEGFKELHLLLINNVLHHFWVFLQLWECITLEKERE